MRCLDEERTSERSIPIKFKVGILLLIKFILFSTGRLSSSACLYIIYDNYIYGLKEDDLY